MAGSKIQDRHRPRASTEMPFGYYNLPFCRPEEGVRESAENLGELLLGDRIENPPYRFRMYTNESDLVLCRTDPFSPAQLALLRQRIGEMYQVDLILDNLPAIRYTHKDEFALRWTGYPVGIRVQDVYYLFNHLKFKVLVHRYEETDVACVIGTGDTEVILATSAKENTPACSEFLTKNLLLGILEGHLLAFRCLEQKFCI